VNVIDLGMNVQMTTDAARFTHNQTSNVLSLENNLFKLVGPALKAKGHTIREVNGGAVGGYQGILFTRDPRLPDGGGRLTLQTGRGPMTLDLWEGREDGLRLDEARTLAVAASILGLGMR